MKLTSVKKGALTCILALVLLAPGLAAAQTKFGSIVVFGTSLSDPGNAFAIIKTMSLPPYDTLDQFLVPSAPYGKGGHHFSNGDTWIELFARPLGLEENVRPAFQGPGTEATDYAVGGARARDVGFDTLSAQVSAFLRHVDNKAPSDALYAVEMGSNDVRDALVAAATGGDAGAVITSALTAIGNNIGALYAAGARKFLVWNVPDIGLTPAAGISGARQAAEFLSQLFNSGLDYVLAGLEAGLPGIEIVKFDAYQKLNDLVAHPEEFGLTNVTAACVTPDIPPFECRNPDEFLFWDGIHPTEAVQAIVAQEVASALGQ